MSDRNNSLGFIGTGIMGLTMARHMVSAGHAMVVNDLAKSSAADLIASGAEFVETPDRVAERSRTVFLSLPGPDEVETVVACENGILSKAQPGDVIVDLSTNSHEMVVSLAATAKAQGVAFLDAPVSGGRVGIENRTLAVMIGGDAGALAQVQPILELFANNIFHVGETGLGTIAKLVNNQVFLSCAVSLQEGFVMAAKAGLDATSLLRIMNKSSGGAYTGMAPLLLSRKFDASLFQLDIARKDLDVALQSARSLEVEMPTTTAAISVYDTAIEKGMGKKVFFATQQVLEDAAGVTVERPRREKNE